MKFSVKHTSRFLLVWLGFFLSVHILTLLAVSYTFLYFGENPMLLYGAGFTIPVLAFVFGRLFFRGLAGVSLGRTTAISVLWTVLFAGLSSALSPVLYGVPWQTEFVELGSLGMDVLVFLALALAGWIQQKRTSGIQEVTIDLLHPDSRSSDEAQADAPSTRSQEASPRS